MFAELVRIIKKPKNILITFFVFVFFFLGSTLFSNYKLVVQIIKESGITFSEKTGVIWSLVGSIQTNFTTLSAITTTVTALLLGVIVSIIIDQVSKQKGLLRSGGAKTSTIGMVSGVLGIGCASCGSLLISTLGLGGILSFLPFGGQEFGVLGVILMTYSLALLLKRIESPVCDTII